MNRAALLAATMLCAFPGTRGARAQGDRNVVCTGFHAYDNVQYDGRFTFVRVEYTTAFGRGFRSRNPGWHHDYPTAECHFNLLLTNLTTAKARHDGSIITTLADPEIFKYPVVYFSEPGEWYPTENEVVAFNKYLRKGGFAIFDDFDNPDMPNLVRQLDRVLPGVRVFRLDANDRIFDTFYRVKTLDFHHPMNVEQKSSFFAIYEDNDPRKRMLCVLNNDNDIGDYWEWSDTGRYGIDPANEAYKLGINYMIYAWSR